MLLFPQLVSGAVAQFPLTKAYSVSNVTNLQEDGSRYRSGNTNPVQIRWVLTYTRLTQLEADVLRKFFEQTSGRLLSFTFLDPLANLLSWSEDLSQPIWAKSALLTISATESNGLVSFQLGNSASGSVAISQVLQCPAAALISFGVYARADRAVSLRLSIEGVQQSFPLTASWKQYFVTETGTGNDGTKTVALSVEGGQAAISRLTVSAQPGPSTYTITQGASGVMPRTRFDQDSLSITVSGIDEFSCQIRLTSRLN